MRSQPVPDVRRYESLLEILQDAERREPDAACLGLFREDGTTETWTRRQLSERGVAAGHRLAQRLGLSPGDRLLVLSASTPSVPAVFFGAMRAGVVVVPLDVRMSADAVGRIAADSGARALALGAGLEAEAARLGLGGLTYATVESLTAVIDRASSAPIDDLAGPPGPGRDDVFEIIYTSGTTGRPKGVTLTHGGIVCCATARHHEAGIVGRVTAPNELRLDADGQVLVRGPGVFRGYWNDPLATAEAIANDGSYRSGDLGHFDRHGSLVLHGRAKDMVVLPNGLNVYPEDVESALRAAGVPESVVVETEPGTLEAIVRAGERLDADGVAAAVREANRHLGTHQRVQRWQLWPDADFPRTHTLKVRRAAVREWAMARRRTPAVA